MRLPSEKLFKAAFGWNFRAWAHPMRRAHDLFAREYDHILEFGASKDSILGIAFDGYARIITIGYYAEEDYLPIRSRFEKISAEIPLKSQYQFKLVNALEEDEQYDLVICKSVLGGIFRAKKFSHDQYSEKLLEFIKRLTNKNGFFVTLDNGKSIFDSLPCKIGSRKNNWIFFSLEDFRLNRKVYTFGFLSAFCLETRLGYLGHVIDNYIIYRIDRFASKIFINSPTIILSIYQNNEFL